MIEYVAYGVIGGGVVLVGFTTVIILKDTFSGSEGADTADDSDDSSDADEASGDTDDAATDIAEKLPAPGKKSG